MKSPFPPFVLEWKVCRQPAKRRVTYMYLKQLSEVSPNLEVHYVCKKETKVLTAEEIVRKWKEIVK
jgi:hypothetical protein